MPKPLLLLRPSGVFARFLLPRDIRAVVGRRFLVHCLRDLRQDAARLAAARMGYALSQAIASHRSGEQALSKKLVDDILAANARGEVRRYEVSIPGVLTIKADGADDHARALEAIGRINLVMPQQFSGTAQRSASGPLLHEAIHRFLEQFKQTARAPATRLETEHSLRLFRDLIDDVPLADVGNTQIDAFRQALTHWPARARVLPAFKNMDARAIVAKGRALPDTPKIEVRTVEKHLDRLRVFFNDAVRRKDIAHNPVAGLRLQTPTAKYEQSYRAFDARELCVLFDPDKRAQHCARDPMYFWVPLLALFTGGRLNEIADLGVGEFNQQAGCWGIHIVPHEGRPLKNHQSKRFVPLPDRFLDLGFLAYAKQIEALGLSDLFPGGSKASKNGAGNKIGKYFNRTYLRKVCEMTDPAVCFHSFRHTLLTVADRLEIPEEKMAPITGHAKRSIQSRHYIDPATVADRKRVLDRIATSFALPSLAAYEPFQFSNFFSELDRKQRRARALEARVTHSSGRLKNT